MKSIKCGVQIHSPDQKVLKYAGRTSVHNGARCVAGRVARLSCIHYIWIGLQVTGQLLPGFLFVVLTGDEATLRIVERGALADVADPVQLIFGNIFRIFA